MRRRRLVLGAVVTSLSLIGCTNADRTGDDHENSRSNNEDESADLIILNFSGNEVVITIKIESKSQIEESISTEGTTRIQSGISEEGTYNMVIETSNNHKKDYQWNVSDWDINGSGGLEIRVYDQELDVGDLE